MRYVVAMCFLWPVIMAFVMPFMNWELKRDIIPHWSRSLLPGLAHRGRNHNRMVCWKTLVTAKLVMSCFLCQVVSSLQLMWHMFNPLMKNLLICQLIAWRLASCTSIGAHSSDTLLLQECLWCLLWWLQLLAQDSTWSQHVDTVVAN